MTAAALDRLQRSFEALGPDVDRMTARFYERLFELRPDTRELFKIDMDLQRRHLASALAMIVRNMQMLDALEQPLCELGARHARVGVLAEHYPPVVESMLLAMADTLGEKWTQEVAADWTEMLTRVAGHMMRGARELAS